MPSAVTHDELNRLVLLLLPEDPERARLAQLSTEANRSIAALNAELAFAAARAATIEAVIIAGTPEANERARLAKERGTLETERLFSVGRLEAVTRAQASAELAYLAYLHRTAQDGLRAARAAHDAAHNAWAGPARRDHQLHQDTRPEYVQERAAVAATLAPLARRRYEATEYAQQWQAFRDQIEAFTVTRYGASVKLANPHTFTEAIGRIADRATSRYRASVAA